MRKRELCTVLQEELNQKVSGGIYHKLQVEFTYNSNHMEGSRLTQEQTRGIFETNTIGTEGDFLPVDDIIETVNHFRCVDFVISRCMEELQEDFIKNLHFILKNGTSESRNDWFQVGEYKKIPNEVGGRETTAPEKVGEEILGLIRVYQEKESVTLEDILWFHYELEMIHPFQDGNGRVGRLIMLKECLKYGIVPFIVDENLKHFYYRGLGQWKTERGFLRDTCLTAQDKFKQYLDYFRIVYEKN